jgi:hypothetical protein
MELQLKDLDARFQRIVEPGKRYKEVDNIQDAHGIMFLCPKCFQANNGGVGTHSVICWFKGRGVSDDENPKPGRWEAVGTGLNDLTLKAGSSSILLTGGCQWHGFIRNGTATV